MLLKEEKVLVEVACCQFEPIVGQKDLNLARSKELILEAVKKGAQLIVLPELCNSGYVFNNREEAYALSETVPEGESVKEWERLAREKQVYIVAGINERDGSNLYNSAVLIGPDGHIGTYRKVHLWDKEKLFFEPGNKGISVFNTPIGRIGILICYDVWFPEAHRLCSIQGAEIIAVPTNWVPMPEQNENDIPMAVYLCMANAHSNGVFIAAANRIGEERGQPFLGHSVIIGPNGRPMGDIAPKNKEEIIIQACDLTKAPHARSLSQLNHVLNDRREDLYGSLII